MFKLYISPKEPYTYREKWIAVANTLGINVVSTLDTPNVLPLTNATVEELIRVPDLNYMTGRVHDILMDSYIRQNYLPAIPVAQTKEEVLALSGPIFVKPRRNSKKSIGTIAYTYWESSQELVNEAWEEFSTAEPELHGMIACPNLGKRLPCLEIDFAVNSLGKVHVIRVCKGEYLTAMRPGNQQTVSDYPIDLISTVEEFCTTNYIHGGIYNLQVVEYAGTSVIMDWNLRPGLRYVDLIDIPGAMEAGLAHMLGLPAPDLPTLYIETREYWNKFVDNSLAERIQSFNLIPSWLWGRDYIGRIRGVGLVKEEVQARFDKMEKEML